MEPAEAIAIFVGRRARLVTLGYLGHMWELYALWTWLSMYIVAGRLERGEIASIPQPNSSPSPPSAWPAGSGD